MAAPKVPEVLDNKTPGSLIDLVFSLREHRKLLETRAGMIKEDERRITEHLIQRMTKHELNALSGKRAKCSISRTSVASAEDWDVVNDWIQKTGSWDIRNKALNQAALRARLDDGVEIPGLKWFQQVKLNVRKI